MAARFKDGPMRVIKEPMVCFSISTTLRFNDFTTLYVSPESFSCSHKTFPFSSSAFFGDCWLMEGMIRKQRVPLIKREFFIWGKQTETLCFSGLVWKNTSHQVMSPRLPMMSSVRRWSVNECEKLLAIGRCNPDFSGVTYQKSEAQRFLCEPCISEFSTTSMPGWTKLRQTLKFLRQSSSANVSESKSLSFCEFFSH